jgi:asparagine synthase (glutamine-hydrolysing)
VPGIAGIITRSNASDTRRLVASMLDSMMHERFYESGTCSVPEVGVCAGWVAHPGSFAARESTAGAADEVSLLLAGECFQDDSAKNRPAVSGPREMQRPKSILPLYDRLGDRCLQQLNGLFSGVIIDRRQGRVLLFNDRYGLERIYVHQTGDATYFASEAKALLRVLPHLRALDDDAVAQFLAFGCVLESKTLFRGIRCLEGGTLWLFKNESCAKSRYFDPETLVHQPALTAEAFSSEFEETFSRVLPRYVGSGADLGISLTGGLDTRMLMACLPALQNQPICYTFSGLNGNMLDQRLAVRVAAECGLQHRVLRIQPDFLSNYGTYVDRTVYVTDGCSGAMGAHEIYFNAQARALAPVRLTGNFGSEVLRSMSTFKPSGLDRSMFRDDFRPKVEESAANAVRGAEHPVIFAAFREIPWNLFGPLAAGRSQVSFRTPYLDNDLVALAFRAPAGSRQSPTSAIQLVTNRRPALSRIPTDRALMGTGGRVSRAARALFSAATFKLDYLHKEGLPHWLLPFDSALGGLNHVGLLGLHKYLPYRLWFRGELAKYVTDVITDPQTARLPYWNTGFLSSLARDHVEGRRNYVREINAVVTLAAVDRLLVRGQPGQN